MKTIRYTPVTDLLTFVTLCTLLIVFYLNNGFPAVILVLGIIVVYTSTVLGANFIKVRSGSLKITYWYLIFWTETIKIKNIVKINSYQTAEDDSSMGESSYQVHRCGYQIEYEDAKGKRKMLHFKIGNRKKESAILAEINNILSTATGS